jgi:hypothetical protein
MAFFEFSRPNPGKSPVWLWYQEVSILGSIAGLTPGRGL